MRVTSFMLFDEFTSSLKKKFEELAKVSSQISSGKRLTKPSDDAISMKEAMAYKVSLNSIDQYKRNVDQGMSRLGFAENQMSSVEHVLQSARELAIAGSDATQSNESRDAASSVAQNLFNEMLNIGNSKFNNKYMFSGFSTNTAAFSSTGAWQGDTNDMNVYIDESVTQTINLNGNTAFSDTTKYMTADLTGATLTGTLQVAVGSGDSMDIPLKDGSTAATPAEIRDYINAPMTKAYADTGTTAVGTGTLTINVGTNDPVTITFDSTTTNTLAGVRDAINSSNAAVNARIATVNGSPATYRMFLYPTTAGEGFSVDVADTDGNNNDTSGLSALLHTDIKSNLTENPHGLQAFVINDGTEERLMFEPVVKGTSFTIGVDEDADATFNETAETDATGLSLLYHASSTTTNLSSSITFFQIMNHFSNSLSNNDTKGIQTSIMLLDGAMDSVIDTTADAGSRMRYLQDHSNRLEDNEIAYIQNLSNVEDADIADAASEFAKIQTALEAMRITSIQTFSKSLFDFLG
ncbi:MAG: flagellar hook-associated protein FlgL [Nitrospira sp.]|nr:flagellar hook-associated protein FlgL [bacterium]MBL7048040.1 flagellar hook-associated protein FlgL [Nitrospira sp.]